MNYKHKVLLLLIALLVNVVAFSQNLNLTLSNVTVRKAMTELKQRTGYSFVYERADLNTKKRVTVNAQSVSEAVRQILQGQDATYEIQGKSIIVRYQIPALSPNNEEKREHQKVNIKISGRVMDEKGEPIIGANIKCISTSAGAITDLNGNYQIIAPTNAVLRVSYIGFTSKDIHISSRQTINITLNEDQKSLDEVVVIGYGTATRRSITGAVDQVHSDALEDKPVANITQALQGAAPNLIIQRKSYNPNGENDNINIRGISTTNSNAPLIVIDGLVMDDGALNNLNPNDIDNISVLKDAGAAAIYGSRSSNGVILVTTKKGQLNSPTTVRLNTSVGWQDPDILFTPVKGYQNATLKNLALTNSGMSPEFTPEQIRDLYNHRKEESWFLPQIFRTALQQNHNLSIQGGSNRTNFMVSLGYFDQESNYVGNKNFGITRYNLRSNITTEVGRFKLSARLAFTRNNSLSTTGSSLEIDAERTPPYYYFKMKENGKYLLNDVLSEFNPLGELEAGGTNKYRNNDFVANLEAEMKIIDGLKLRGVFGVDVAGQSRYTRTLPVPYYYSSDQDTPSRYNLNNYTDNWNYDSYLINSQLLLDYNKLFGLHNVNALLGITNESYTGRGNEVRIDYANIDLGTSGRDEAEIVLGNGSHVFPEDQSRTSITSVLGRFGYNWQERYYAEFNFRVDGSSKFASKNRWGFFPSLSLGWRISSEPWMKQYQNKVGDLKIRGSYGVLGNQTIGTYDRYTTYNIYNNTYAYNNQTVTGAGFTLGSEDLKWEKTRTANLGADAIFLHNALNISFDYFYKRTVDILMRPVVPSAFGTSQNMANLGEVSNRGWELSINYRLKTRDFVHDFTGNIGDSYNKLEKYPETEKITSSDEINFLTRVGVPLGSYYGYKTDGLFQSYEEIAASAIPVGASVQPGDLKFVDRNHDGIIDSKDRYILGNAFPRYTFGFTYSFNWKGFDFSLFTQGVCKRDMAVRGELMEPFHQNYSYVIFKHQLDFWTPTNTDAKYPRLSAAGSADNSNNFRQASDLYILNGAYMRLKNITLGYTLPQAWAAKMGIRKLRVYMTGQNLLTFSHNSFIDPESSEFNNQMQNGGANSARNYPTLKYYGFGLDLEF